MKTPTVNVLKRNYHPLVMYNYYTNRLTKNQRSLIPITTRNYWDKHKLEFMYGFDWVKEFSTNLEDITTIQKHKIIVTTQVGIFQIKLMA